MRGAVVEAIASIDILDFRLSKIANLLNPDVIPALVALRKRHRLFALSNGNADLDLIGLGGYFELHATARGNAQRD